MSDFYQIFNMLDAPKKYYGATLIEISAVVVVMLLGLILDKAVVSFGIAIFTFKLIRRVSHSNKFTLFKRWIFFLHRQNRFFL